ncbi:magnesium transporter [Aquisalibacillus elongatus]|uniref:Magnesium transporter MgtE n=1 Tax=Aquisalibacillus elongatus TaxID=485577 RepID=A0A3N5C6R6_9BACI|nr:magnesium transporter [Aquisalibacillus elongatus]RPF52121.1 magnesium transporter [Aquisalibacillus elongatus]
MEVQPNHKSIEYEWIIERIHNALKEDSIDLFRSEFLELHPYDQANIFVNLPKDIRLQIYTYLSPDEMSEIIEHFELEDVGEIITEMNPRFAAQIFDELSTDDAVDIMNTLERNQIASYLTLMQRDEAKEIKDLLHYEERTAGSIMTTEFVVVNQNMTIRQAMLHLREKAPDAETIYYVFVTDNDKRLAGVISLRDLIIAEDDWVVSDIMSEHVVYASAGDDQEYIARLMRDYDFLALPVVDFKKHLLGIITVDDILDVMDEEASDDYSKLAAVRDMDRNDLSAWDSARKRLPWLIILLFLGMITASLIGQFENTLEQVAILAVFIPLIAGMAGNTGTQALAVTVRGIATGDAMSEGVLKRLKRETLTGLITGVVCGIVITLIIMVWQGMSEIHLGLVVGFSIMISLIVATIAGAFLPLLMHKLKIDPAVASGPFITTINDTISVIIYFGTATIFMEYLV